MQQRDTPYVFGDYDDRDRRDTSAAIERDPDSGAETVIDDGLAMSYRSYRRRQG